MLLISHFIGLLFGGVIKFGIYSPQELYKPAVDPTTSDRGQAIPGVIGLWESATLG